MDDVGFAVMWMAIAISSVCSLAMVAIRTVTRDHQKTKHDGFDLHGRSRNPAPRQDNPYYSIVSDEWTEYHLTRAGWGIGSTKVDRPSPQLKPPPDDRVMTVRYRETLRSPFEPMDRHVSILWQLDDAVVVETLLGEFGPCPESL